MPSKEKTGGRYLGHPVLDESGGNRTHNLWIKSPLLCQLSYAPVLPAQKRRALLANGGWGVNSLHVHPIDARSVRDLTCACVTARGVKDRLTTPHQLGR